VTALGDLNVPARYLSSESTKTEAKAIVAGENSLLPLMNLSLRGECRSPNGPCVCCVCVCVCCVCVCVCCVCVCVCCVCVCARARARRLGKRQAHNELLYVTPEKVAQSSSLIEVLQVPLRPSFSLSLS
jgi:hypothetical protein